MRKSSKFMGAIAALAVPSATVIALAIPATASAQTPTLDGTWEMTFQPTSNIGGFNKVRPYTREWIFGRANGRIHVWRETKARYIRLRVRRFGPVYKTVWISRGACRNTDGYFRYTETITFTLKSASRITGRLVGHSPVICVGKTFAHQW